jgi:hypothetical protein
LDSRLLRASQHLALGAVAVAQRVRAARAEWGWSQNDLAAEVARVRAKQRLKTVDIDSLRRQIVEFERGRQPGRLWRTLLAEALWLDEESLFGLAVDTDLAVRC